MNITPSQKGQYRVYALEGVSHASFMDSSMIPEIVKKNDLSPEIDEQEGHQKIAQTMVGWISDVLGNQNKLNSDLEAYTADFFDPLIYAMK